MPIKRLVLLSLGGFAIAVVARKVVVSRQPSISELGPGRWRAVTVNRRIEEITPNGLLPLPLRELEDSIEVELSEAPGGKGTELAARLRSGEPSGASSLVARITGHDPRQDVRRALRESKQLIETGEIIRLDPQPQGHRPATPAGKLIDEVSERSDGEGVL